MIIGLGCDIVNIERINKSKDFLQHFKHRILGADEQAEIQKIKLTDNKAEASCLAKYYAGKEAFAKALGTGFRDGLFLKDIQILHDALGKPQLSLSGEADTSLRRLSATAKTYISLSDDYPYAQAVVVIEE